MNWLSRSRTSQELRRHYKQYLSLEKLEPRYVLSGSVYLINFQLSGSPTPTSYVKDAGELFGDRGNGLAYGWSSDHTDVARDRGLDPDQRTDTLIHFHQNQNWELELPNGSYEVTAVLGDPENNDGLHTLNVENVSFFDNVPDGDSPISVTDQVTVNDGRLTLDMGTAAEKATRINYLHVVSIPSGANTSPSIPIITEPAEVGQMVNPTDVHMEAVGFFDVDGDTHASSDWEIWTAGPDAERAWITLGITGVERFHTHLGDGFFENSHVNRNDLFANTDYELRVRFRDSKGSVSGYATRQFQTTSASTILPLQIEGISSAPAPTWNTVFGNPLDLPADTAIFSPTDTILAIDTNSASSYPANEPPQHVIDGTLAKYLNGGEVNSGFIITPSTGASVVGSFQITTANDFEERDPASWLLFGTNEPIVSTDNSDGSAENWSFIDGGSLSLPNARNALGPMELVNSSTSYSSYRMIFPAVKNAAVAEAMQIAEIQFFAADTGLTIPPALRVESAQSALMLEIEGNDQPGNTITHFPVLSTSKDIRIVISGGSNGLSLQESDLTFTDEMGNSHTVFLPAVSLAANEDIYLWVALDGSTYFGTPAQTESDFSSIAREALLDNPFVAIQPGFVVEEIAGGFQLPTNIAFIPNPGGQPDDPLFYVTELYGTIKVVTNDGTVSDYATGLLNFNPTGNFPGSGEQGLTGIVVDSDTGDVIVSRVRDTDGLPGGEHHPQVVRFSSNDGGMTASSETVLLDMIGESQGQSHQISNLSIGPDGMLYVHNGDGFDASTALNLDSYRGKILRMDLNGNPLPDNPFYDLGNGINSRDYIFAYGFRNPFGGAWRASDGALYEVENGPSVDRLAKVDQGGNYGWNGTDASMQINAIYNWDPAHAPVNITFIEDETFGGSNYPNEYRDLAYVSESGPTYGLGPQALGKRIVSFELDSNGDLLSGPESFVEYIGTGRGSVVGLASGPDGLYFTELYKDLNALSPIDAGARVFRVRYIGDSPADFNFDGYVDDLDLSIWEENFGTRSGASRATGDTDEDHDVDGLDFLSWQRNYTGGSSFPVTTQPQTVATVEQNLVNDPDLTIAPDVNVSEPESTFSQETSGNQEPSAQYVDVAAVHIRLHSVQLKYSNVLTENTEAVIQSTTRGFLWQPDSQMVFDETNPPKQYDTIRRKLTLDAAFELDESSWLNDLIIDILEPLASELPSTLLEKHL